MSGRMTPEREREIREWLPVARRSAMGRVYERETVECAEELLVELDAVRAGLREPDIDVEHERIKARADLRTALGAGGSIDPLIATDNPRRIVVLRETRERFIVDLLAVCRRHELSLSHEDEHGAFRVIEYNSRAAQWLLDAQEGR